jgi:hypothetical protein
MLLAGFLLPLGILYFVSGALYTLNIKGHIEKQVFTVSLEAPFTPDLERLTGIVKQALIERTLPVPAGEPLLRKRHGRYQLRWDDLAHVVTLVPGRDPKTVALTVRQRSMLTQVMRVHRGDAGTTFRVLAIILAAGLVVLFATGVQMAHAVPKFRKPVLLSVAGGVLTVVALFLL